MKKLLSICLITIMSLSVAVAAEKTSSKESSKSTKTEVKVQITTTVFDTNIDCAECEKKIMNKIPSEKGVTDVKVDLKTKKVTVSYDSSKNSDVKLIKSFSKIKIEAKVAKR